MNIITMNHWLDWFSRDMLQETRVIFPWNLRTIDFPIDFPIKPFTMNHRYFPMKFMGLKPVKIFPWKPIHWTIPKPCFQAATWPRALPSPAPTPWWRCQVWSEMVVPIAGRLMSLKIPWLIDCEKGDLILPGLLGIMITVGKPFSTN